MSTWGDISPTNNPRGESFQEWIDEGIIPVKSEDVKWHNEDIHTIWRPPPRCLTCRGHRVSQVKGRRPIATRHLGILAWLAELPMRWLALSMRNKDSRTWTMEEDIPPMQFNPNIHAQFERYRMRQYGDELGPE